jgi:outer membrane protein TolC
VRIFSLIFPIILFLLFEVAIPIHAQSSDSLSLEKAIDLALKKNELIAVSEIEKQENESHLTDVQSTRLPFFFLRSHYLYAPANGYSEVVTNGGEYGLQLTTALPLFDAGIRSNTIHQATNSVERSSVELKKSKTEVTYNVRTAYCEIIRAENELTIRKETVQRLQDYVSFLAQLQESGSINASDVMKARVEFNDANIDVKTAEQSLLKGKMALNRLTGNPINQQFEITFGGVGDTASIPQFSVDDAPDLLLLKHDKISAGDDIAIAKAERYPTVSFAGDIGWLGVTANEYRENFGYSIFLNLDLPLWSWGGIDARIQQKELSQQLIDKQMEIQKRDLELQWNTTISDIKYARSALGEYSRNIGEAEKNYLLAKSRFAGGSGSNLEVLDAQRLLVEIKLKYNETLAQLNSSFACALKLSGQ